MKKFTSILFTVLTLSASLPAQSMRFFATAYDESGDQEIESVREGEKFTVKIFTEDVSNGDPQGVFGAYVDILFDAEKLSFVDDGPKAIPDCRGFVHAQTSAVAHKKPYTCGIATPTFPAPGRIDAAGGFSEVFETVLGPGKFEVLSFQLRADSVGQAFINTESTSEPNDPFDIDQSISFGALIYGQDDFICPNADNCIGSVEYFGDTITILPGVGPCDFSGDGILGLADVNGLIEKIRAGENDATFDVNSDQVVNRDDLTAWIVDCKKTWFGDANLDGEFNSTDLVFVFQAGEYEDNIADNSTWGEGDWNADGNFESGDLVVAFQDGGFELGPRPDVATVPEPHSCFAILVFAVAVLRIRRRAA